MNSSFSDWYQLSHITHFDFGKIISVCCAELRFLLNLKKKNILHITKMISPVYSDFITSRNILWVAHLERATLFLDLIFSGFLNNCLSVAYQLNGNRLFAFFGVKIHSHLYLVIGCVCVCVCVWVVCAFFCFSVCLDLCVWKSLYICKCMRIYMCVYFLLV